MGLSAGCAALNGLCPRFIACVRLISLRSALGVINVYVCVALWDMLRQRYESNQYASARRPIQYSVDQLSQEPQLAESGTSVPLPLYTLHYWHKPVGCCCLLLTRLESCQRRIYTKEHTLTQSTTRVATV